MGGNIKMDLKEIEWMGVDRIHLAPSIGTGGGFLKLSGSMKGEDILIR
jgi:hypothetical protein